MTPPPSPLPSQKPWAMTRASSSSHAALEGVQTRMRGRVFTTAAPSPDRRSVLRAWPG